MKIHFIMSISRSGWWLIFRVASHNLSNFLQFTWDVIHINLLPSSQIWNSNVCGWTLTILQDCKDFTDEIFSLILLSLNDFISQTVWHKALSHWKISPSSSKSDIKLFFSNLVYLVLFKLPSILTNFLEPLDFMYPQNNRLLPLNFTIFIV